MPYIVCSWLAEEWFGIDLFPHYIEFDLMVAIIGIRQTEKSRKDRSKQYVIEERGGNVIKRDDIRNKRMLADVMIVTKYLSVSNVRSDTVTIFFSPKG